MKIIIIISLIMLIGTAKADLGVPTIQAICKVTLSNGEVVEGFISFGGGGFDYKYKPNGFCFINKDGKEQLILYDFSFDKLIPANNTSYRNGNLELFYLENITKQRTPEIDTKFDKDSRILTKTTLEKQEYRLYDRMILFDKIPKTLYIGKNNNKEDDYILIKIIDIKSIEILKNPDQIWLEKIKLAKKKLNEEMKKSLEKNGNGWVDYFEPVWYHEIVKDKQKMNELQKYF